jgi:hypothetical protein
MGISGALINRDVDDRVPRIRFRGECCQYTICQAAQSVAQADSSFGAYDRAMGARLEPKQANLATAHTNVLTISFSRRCDSAAIVSNTLDDLPKPDTPVKMVILRLGMRNETFFKKTSQSLFNLSLALFCRVQPHGIENERL